MYTGTLPLGEDEGLGYGRQPQSSCAATRMYFNQREILCRGYNLNPLALARERLYVHKKNHLTCLRMFVFQVLVLGWIGHIWRVIVSVDPH